MENDLKGNENYFVLMGGSSYKRVRVIKSRLYSKQSENIKFLMFLLFVLYH